MTQSINRIGLATGLSFCSQVQSVQPEQAKMVTLHLVPTLGTNQPIQAVRPIELIGVAGSPVDTQLSLAGYNLVPNQQLIFPSHSGVTQALYYTPKIQSARVHFRDRAGHELVPAVMAHGDTTNRLNLRQVNGVVSALVAAGRRVMQDQTRERQLTDCEDCQEYAIIFA